MNIASALISGSEHAIRQYNKMSSSMWAPEGYIRDLCAVYVHENLNVPVSTEVSHNLFKALYDFDESASIELRDELSQFQVDLVIHNSDNRKLAAVVEFKLYTGPSALADIEKLRTHVRAAEKKGEALQGFLVIPEQALPRNGLNYVRDAFDSFGKKVHFIAQKFFEIEETQTFDRYGVRQLGRWPIGIGVIDIGKTLDQ